MVPSQVIQGLYHALRPFRADRGGGQAARMRPTIPTSPSPRKNQNRTVSGNTTSEPLKKAPLSHPPRRAPTWGSPTGLAHPIGLGRKAFVVSALEKRLAMMGSHMITSFSLALKCAATSREPLRWKGGCVSPFYKLKGPTNNPNSFRASLSPRLWVSAFIPGSDGPCYQGWTWTVSPLTLELRAG